MLWNKKWWYKLKRVSIIPMFHLSSQMPWWSSLHESLGIATNVNSETALEGLVVTILMFTLCVNLAWNSDMSQNLSEPTLHGPAFSCFQSLPSFSNGWKSSLSALSLSIRARRALDHGWNPCETTRFWLSIPKNLQFSLVPILLRQSMAISYFQPDPRWSKGGVGQTFPMTKVAFKYPMIFSWYSHDIGSGDTPNHPGVDQFRSLFRPQSPEAPGRATSSAVYHQWGPWPTCHRRIPRRTSQGISPGPFSGDHVSSCVFFGFPLTFFWESSHLFFQGTLW